MIKINNEQEKINLTEEDFKIIEKIFSEMIRAENLPSSVEVSLTLTNNEEIKELNKEYRKIDSVTDVLSFPIYEEDELDNLKNGTQLEQILLGDIVISLERVDEQSKEFGHSFRRELMYLFVHGMLHLLGHDHLEEDEKKEMRSREEAILEKFSLTR